MKYIIKIIITITVSLSLYSCAGGVFSKNIVGLKEYKIDSQQIDGVWINNKGAILLKTLNAYQGIVKVTVLQDKNDLVNIGPLTYQIMKGESWLYFNLLSVDGNKENVVDKESTADGIRTVDTEAYYRWGRIIIDGNRIILWTPSMTAFVKAIDRKSIMGSYRSSPDTANTSKITTVIITDTAANIIKLVEQADNVFFDWDDPDFFIKIIK